ncbi:MAG: YdcF family protein [Kofleriaceae bacterium]|nr:YdcF family protein [Kofleriaceae bacterium]
MIDRGLRSLLWAFERPLMVAAVPASRRDVILVLGAPLTVHGTLSRVLHERVATAAMLWQHSGAAAVVVSGGVTRSGLPSEAAAMADELLTAGVPLANIVVEQHARTTRENADFAATLMTARNWRSAWVVTQPFHVRRAVRLCRDAGIDAHGWVMQQSVQYAQPLLGLRWTAREYAAWAAMMWRQNLARPMEQR